MIHPTVLDISILSNDFGSLSGLCWRSANGVISSFGDGRLVSNILSTP